MKLRNKWIKLLLSLVMIGIMAISTKQVIVSINQFKELEEVCEKEIEANTIFIQKRTVELTEYQETNYVDREWLQGFPLSTIKDSLITEKRIVSALISAANSDMTDKEFQVYVTGSSLAVQSLIDKKIASTNMIVLMKEGNEIVFLLVIMLYVLLLGLLIMFVCKVLNNREEKETQEITKKLE